MLERKDDDGNNKTCSNRQRKNCVPHRDPGLSETRRNGSGEHRIPQTGILLYSGKPIKDKHESVVGILLSPKAHKSLIEWKPISDRIIMARFLTKLRKLVVFQCYAPIEQAIREEKDAFYETLENTLRHLKR
jgi:hypothetical protein